MWPKKAKTLPLAAVSPANPKPKTKTVFSISSRRLAESEDGLDSSLVQSGGELQRCKLAPKFWWTRDRVKKGSNKSGSTFFLTVPRAIS